ncbi:ST6GAL1 [Branchiostoma lanceolatum]|uniref:beta-galactoside alpha-(2,6)-sialyltransferase n=1 Tax=Branchiostoma lanceolatum TaxID=7740 RepID=A0A8J9W4D5_BRALA|nr:ST6GAL1 [Branchiostoma lanceolatum]
MTKRTLLFFVTGLCVCIMVYGILSSTLLARIMHMPCRIVNDVQQQLQMVRNITPEPLLSDQGVNRSQRSDGVDLVGTSEKVLSNRTGIRPSDADTVFNSREEMPCVSDLREELLCALKKNVPFSTITRKQASRDVRNVVLPEESLEKLAHFNSCAVVSSSHALRLHTYGQEIDSHDIVLRFNCAPTDQFEQFVGSRTDIRMINTLVPLRHCQEEFWSRNSTMFKHGILVVGNMDGINFGPRGSLDIRPHIRQAFDNLVKYSRTFPKRAKPFIQRPRFGQDIMAELARFCVTTGLCDRPRLRPSSGMLGIVMMLHLCDWVRVYELVPSNKDDSKLMYYFDEKTMWTAHDMHSYSQERVYVRTLSLTPEKGIEHTGVVLLKGFSQTQCD